MKRLWAVFLLAAWVLVGEGVGVAVWAAEGLVWENKTANLPEVNIRVVCVPSQNKILLAASDRHLYRTEESAVSWKQVLGVRSPDQIVDVVEDPVDTGVFWLATRRTIRRSEDQGRTWKIIFQRQSEVNFQIRCIAKSRGGALYVGTTQGLFQLDHPDGRWSAVPGSPKNVAVEALSQTMKQKWIILTGRGIYEAGADWSDWSLREAAIRPEAAPESSALEQFSVEEIASTPIWANVIAFPAGQGVFAGRADGLLSASESENSGFERLPEANGFRIRKLAADEKFVYLATDRGVYRMDAASRKLENISEGLESLSVFTVFVDASGRLWVGTAKGVFSLGAALAPPVTNSAQEGIVPNFGTEPSIAEIQRAAISYAEVSPEKINAWREAASRKAWLPTVSLKTDLSDNENIDVDRGGTNDPDRFIAGPNEKSVDWSVGVAWDLGDLVWNDDQTSIDVRSRLMVELRNDVLNEVTHLYFERRRLQMELAALPADVPKLRMDKDLKLQELTAQLDALTGGFLSARLAQKEGAM